METEGIQLTKSQILYKAVDQRIMIYWFHEGVLHDSVVSVLLISPEGEMTVVYFVMQEIFNHEKHAQVIELTDYEVWATNMLAVRQQWSIEAHPVSDEKVQEAADLVIEQLKSITSIPVVF